MNLVSKGIATKSGALFGHISCKPSPLSPTTLGLFEKARKGELEGLVQLLTILTSRIHRAGLDTSMGYRCSQPSPRLLGPRHPRGVFFCLLIYLVGGKRGEEKG